MAWRRIHIACWLASAICLTGCRQDAKDAFPVPEQLILYSIDGRDFDDPKVAKTGEFVQRFPVLGKVEIVDARQRQEIMRALSNGRTPGKMGAACFWPRHALRAVQDGETIDYVICFQCAWLEVYKGDTKPQEIVIDTTAQDLLNHLLKQAGVPLAPGAEGETP